jgi:ribA/ribD-fused uncharacterized protein
MSTPKVIDDFHGQYAFLSNFHFNPILLAGKIWDTTEHYYQAQKFRPDLLFSEFAPDTMWEHVRKAGSPSEAYRISHRYRTYWDKTFEERKFMVMSTCVFEKFAQHRTLRHQLIETGRAELVEGNAWHDNYWGNCRCGDCAKIEGQNMLGKLLMQLRDEFGRIVTQAERTKDDED